MILTLEVMGEQAKDLGTASRRVFDSIGGTIGRLPDNDWVFPDPYVSGRHALIRYLNGKFFVEDTSTNGVFVNSPDHRIQRGQAYQLKDGDLLYIDAYRIQVTIAKPIPAQREERDPFELLDPRAVRNDRTVAMPSREHDCTEALARHGDGAAVEWFDTSADEPVAKVSVAPPKRLAPPPSRTAPPAPREAKSSSHARAEGELLREMIASAGMAGVEPSKELARTLGAVLRVAVGGVMDVLRARERMKDDMRVRGTTFKAADNNPLKFSANVDDAFHNLFVKHNAAYLGPPEAFDDALRDIREHQAALVAAVRLAFEAMLARFDPARLTDDFDRHMKKGSLLGTPAKLRYWDAYCEKFADMAKDADTSFRTLFGEEFAKAYEDQLERLHAAARSRTK